MNIVGLLGSVIKPVFDSVFKWKSQSDKMEITRQQFEIMKKETEAAIELRIMEEMRKPQSEFRNFLLEYEGSAEIQTPFMRNFRSSVRPVITYWSLVVITLIIFGMVGGEEIRQNLEAIPEPLWNIFLAIFGFWFGGRAVMQVADKWKQGDVKRTEVEGNAKVEEARLQVELAKVELEKQKQPEKKSPAKGSSQDEFWDEDEYWFGD
jgi:hypothetical protein